MELSKLTLNPENPRFIREEKVEKLVDKILTGFLIPSYRMLAVDKSDSNLVYAGNQRTRCFRIISEWSLSELKKKLNALIEDKAERKEAFSIFF